MTRLLLLAPLLLAACVDELSTRDTITKSAGTAMRANAAIMTVDPQAHRGDKVVIHSSGKRVAAAMERYHSEGEAPEGSPADQLLRAIPQPVENPLNPTGNK